jgi:phage shock protein PspC (stress-responsive transcriptional regulator)
MYGQLLRPRFDRKVAGVCAAFARAYGWDTTVVRIAVLLLAVFTGFGFIAYLVCWIAIPEDPVGAPPYVAGYGVPPAYPPPPPPPDTYPPTVPPGA